MKKETLKPKQPCESPNHNKDCPCIKCVSKNCTDCPLLTKDHFTPQCIAKVLGWSRYRTNRNNNIQWLTRPCHDDKDRDTAKRKDVLVSQLAGKNISLQRHQMIFLPMLSVEKKPHV